MVAHGARKAAPNGEANGSAKEGCEGGHGPRGLLPESGREPGLASAPLHLGHKLKRSRAKSAKGADGEDDEAAARREGTHAPVVVAQTPGLLSAVGGKAHLVRVVRGEVSAPRDVKGLHVHEQPRVR